MADASGMYMADVSIIQQTRLYSHVAVLGKPVLPQVAYPLQTMAGRTSRYQTCCHQACTHADKTEGAEAGESMVHQAAAGAPSHQ